MTAKTAPKRKPKQTVKQRLELAQKATNQAWGEGYLAGRAVKSVAPNTFVEVAREPEATIRPSWLARMWKWVRG